MLICHNCLEWRLVVFNRPFWHVNSWTEVHQIVGGTCKPGVKLHASVYTCWNTEIYAALISSPQCHWTESCQFFPLSAFWMHVDHALCGIYLSRAETAYISLSSKTPVTFYVLMLAQQAPGKGLFQLWNLSSKLRCITLWEESALLYLKLHVPVY